jgi:hypothetical protein
MVLEGNVKEVGGDGWMATMSSLGHFERTLYYQKRIFFSPSNTSNYFVFIYI